jgi:hypothetical protein
MADSAATGVELSAPDRPGVGAGRKRHSSLEEEAMAEAKKKLNTSVERSFSSTKAD